MVADLLKVSGKKTSYDNDVTLCKQHNIDNFVMGASFALLPDDDWFADSRITVTCYEAENHQLSLCAGACEETTTF